MSEPYLDLNNNKEQIKGISFARALCAIGIVIFHYFCHSNGTFKFLYTSANAGWGEMFVTTFFAISGAVLYYNYPSIQNTKKFYLKRLKAIFPYFYLCWLLFFIERVIYTKNVFWGGHPIKLFLTIFGMDGFFVYRIPNYYLVGEWFLGAILFLYLLYPLFSWVMNKNLFILPIVLLIGYIIMLCTSFFLISDSRNLITCIASLYFGMITVKYKSLFFESKVTGLISLLILIFLCCFKLPNIIIIHQIQGFGLFLFLIFLGNYVMKTKIEKLFLMISKLSFCIFLLHHMIILHVFKIYNPSNVFMLIILLFAILITTVLLSNVLYIITNRILNKIIKK